MNSTQLLGVRIDLLERKQFKDTVRSFLEKERGVVISTPNPEILLSAHRDASYKHVLNACDINIPDGIGVVALIRLVNKIRAQRITGVDAVELLAEIASEDRVSMVLFGAEQGNAVASARILNTRNTSTYISGIEPGVISYKNDAWHISPEDLQHLRDAQPVILAVALGHGKQERFAQWIMNEIPSIKIAIGVGGALDMISGKIKRAPKILQKIGFEWLWRLLQEPRRIGRIINATIIFPITVISSKLTNI